MRGMDTIGQLFPPACQPVEYPSQGSAWEGVANSFYQAGNDLRFAIKERPVAKRESKQAT
jgi:hypothetical protein